MTERKWTKGPWMVQPPEHGYDNVSLEGGLGGIFAADECICEFGADDTYYNSCGQYPSPANANLIAAAPDLYEALENLLYAMRLEHPYTTYPEAEKALAKARGEQ